LGQNSPNFGAHSAIMVTLVAYNRSAPFFATTFHGFEDFRPQCPSSSPHTHEREQTTETVFSLFFRSSGLGASQN
jgi:hypothetical protein